MLDSAWIKIENSDLKYYRTNVLVNRANAKRLLGDIIGAISDIDVALKMKPDDPGLNRYRALCAYESGDNKTAIEILEKICPSRDVPDASLLLAVVLHKEGTIEQAIKIIGKFLETELTQTLKIRANKILIALYMDSRNFFEAKKVCANLLSA